MTVNGGRTTIVHDQDLLQPLPSGGGFVIIEMSQGSTPMTSTQLNDQCAEILDAMEILVARFDSLRNLASDDAWDEACTEKPYLDLLSDIEYEVEQALEAVRV